MLIRYLVNVFLFNQFFGEGRDIDAVEGAGGHHEQGEAANR